MILHKKWFVKFLLLRSTSLTRLMSYPPVADNSGAFLRNVHAEAKRSVAKAGHGAGVQVFLRKKIDISRLSVILFSAAEGGEFFKD